ncbi:MAG TPA: S24 family peptidase [Planctomycetota bacterium]|nr:S24 family peptidase [Planctomycetota bacterium]
MVECGLDFKGIVARILELKGDKKTQKEWAEELRIPPSYLSDWKKGKRRPSLSECYRVILLTNCETEWLLYGVGARYASPDRKRQKAIYSPNREPSTGLVDPLALIREGLEMIGKGGAFVEGRWVREAELFFGSARKNAVPDISQEGTREPGERSKLCPAKYVPCFRLASDEQGSLKFDSEGIPAGEPVKLVAAEEVCDPLTFAVEVEDDSMAPAFNAGNTLIFAMRAKKETRSGDYALVRTPDGIVFRQVWFEGEEVRLHPMDPTYPEKRIQRDVVEGIIPLFARYQRF